MNLEAVQLWWIHPEAYVLKPEDWNVLSEEERAQQQRFIPPIKRHEYAVTRLLVRKVLSRTLGLTPQELAFVPNEWGRPAVAGSTAVRFNLSHTEGLVVCAVSSSREVGVDTELRSRAPRILGMAERVFAPLELAELLALPESAREERAVTLWTLKESYIKARGRGLSLALDGFAFRFQDERISLDVEPRLDDVGSRWQFQVHAFGAHRVSVAVEAPAEATPVHVTWCEGAQLLSL